MTYLVRNQLIQLQIEAVAKVKQFWEGEVVNHVCWSVHLSTEIVVSAVVSWDSFIHSSRIDYLLCLGDWEVSLNKKLIFFNHTTNDTDMLFERSADFMYQFNDDDCIILLQYSRPKVENV